MKIGILGGTFDPIHQGHLFLARIAKRQLGLDKILFIPAFIPPHKASRRDLTPAPYRHRMVEIAILGEQGFEISKVELDRPDISYTVDTLRLLKEQYPKAPFYLIMGTDTLKEISNWHKPDEIRKLATFLVASRQDQKEKGISRKGVVWIDMPVCPYSSSAIRELLHQGISPGAMLPPGVEDYIRSMKLYGRKSG